MKEINTVQNTTSKREATKAIMAASIMFMAISGVAGRTVTLYAAKIIEDFGILRTQFMLTTTIYATINMIFSLFLYGPIVSKIGSRRYVLLGFTFSAVGYMIYALAPNISVFYIGAVIYGIGISPLNTTTMYFISNAWYKKNVGTMASIPNTCGNGMGIISTAVYGLLIANLGRFIPMWITVGIIILAAVLFSILYKGTPEDRGMKAMYADEVDSTEDIKDEPEEGLSRSETLKSPKFYLLGLAYMLLAAVGFSTYANIALFANDLGFTAQAGTFISVSLITCIITLTPGGIFIDKFGTKWFVLLSVAIQIVANMMLRNHSLSMIGLYAACALLGISFNLCGVSAGVSMREVFGPRDYGKKIGIMVGMSFIGTSFGPTIFSMFYDAHGNYDTGLLVFSALGVLGVVLVWIITANCKYREHGKKAK